ncbi:MAG TPA: type II secretion system major pseudopilin GspG [Azospirillum sp.]|nr:type II secretion system major pseudopilin GspG [Azospirillum sp.]
MRGDAGFTLIELLVVLVILGLLAGMVGPQVLGYVGSSKSKAARVQIEQIAAALDLYRLDVGRYPTSQQGLKALVEAPGGVKGWSGPYLAKGGVPADPWGNPYTYKAPGRARPFDITSLGRDGREGGDGEDADIGL